MGEEWEGGGGEGGEEVKWWTLTISFFFLKTGGLGWWAGEGERER